MFKCRVEKRIHKSVANKNDYTLLKYELEIETVPELGQVLKDGQWYSGPLKNVIWAIDDHCFHCRVGDEFPFVQGHENFSHEWIVETFQREGWSLCANRVIRID